MTPDQSQRDMVLRAAGSVLPRLVVAALVLALLLGIALLLLTEGAAMVRGMVDGLPRPWRGIAFTALLAIPMVALGLAGRKLMEYNIFVKQEGGKCGR